VIGSSEGMEAAYTVTDQSLIDADTQQVIESGADPDSLTVTIDGRPSFGANEPAPTLGDVEMTPATGGVACVLSDDLGGINELQ